MVLRADQRGHNVKKFLGRGAYVEIVLNSSNDNGVFENFGGNMVPLTPKKALP